MHLVLIELLRALRTLVYYGVFIPYLIWNEIKNRDE